MTNVEMLRRVPLFSGLRAEDLDLLDRMATVKFCSPGEVVSKAGDTGGDLAVVAEGELAVTLGEGDERVELKRLGRGDFFGELGLIDQKPHSADVTATTRTIVLMFSRGVVANFLAHNYGVALEMMNTLVERVRSTDEILTKRVVRNAVREHEGTRGFGQRLADSVAEFNGSWRFIIGSSVIITAWFLFAKSFDPYPYQFLNIVLGIWVYLQGPLIVMSQNRQAAKDRAQADANYELDLKDELHGEQIAQDLKALHEKVDQLLASPVKFDIVQTFRDQDPE